MSTSNYEKEHNIVDYKEDDEQYVVDADDGQHYEEYIDVGSETAVPAYCQNEPRSRITSSNIKVVTATDIPIADTKVPVAFPRSFPHRNVLPIGVPNYVPPGPLRHPPIPHAYFGPLRQRELNFRSVYGAAANYPIIGGSLSLPSFLNKSTKPSKSRRMASKRKPCNCTKSMCLKLYCDCFSNGEFCLDCNCKDCHNNLEHDAERSRAIKQSLERNPSAFKPKIGVAAKNIGKTIDMERLHQRGCHCKRSNCLKNYCECYEAKVPCTDRCKCQSCRNTEHDRHNKFRDKFTTTAGGLAQLAAAAAAESHARAGTPLSEDDASDICAGEEETTTRQTNPKTQPWFYMTEDVIEATTMCLVSQAQEFEQTLSEEELEKSILREFGRCLEQIIESANSCLPQKSNTSAPFHLPTSSSGV